MKAIILAGGSGTRLRPLSLTRPKPMVRLLDKPLLEHIILLLRDNGFDEICVTLQYLPGMVKDYFGDGRSLGVFLEYRTEDKPLGTAGCVKACSDFIGGEDVLIVSGDAACRLDFKGFYDKHIGAGADASLLLKRCLEPMEYGLVITDKNERITSFIEKPSEDRVYSDLVNTGIYAVGKSVLDMIPENKAVDFGAELFPRMLREGKRLYGFETEGYWNDVGSCAAYLKTSFDFLDPKTKVYISDAAAVQPGSRLGPNAVICAGSRIGSGCDIRDSVIDGALIGTGCVVTGAIVCPGAVVGDRCVISEGSVIADGAAVGPDSYISEAVRLWPKVSVRAGSRVMRSITDGKNAYAPIFSAKGTLSGEAVCDINPELALLMGMSKAKATRCGAAYLAGADGGYASVLAGSFLAGCRAAGRRAFSLDSPIAATAAFAGRALGLDMTLFAAMHGKSVVLSFFDKNGLPIPRKTQRDIEAACLSESVRAGAEDCADLADISGTFDMHAAAAAGLKNTLLEGLSLSARGAMLEKALKAYGINILPYAEGRMELALSADGFELTALDETGRKLSYGELLCALVYVELSRGGGSIVLPYEAPSAADALASSLGGTLYRLGRDGDKAAEEWSLKPLASDGLFLAFALCGWLAENKAGLCDLAARIPEFHTAESEYRTNASTARLLKSFARSYQAELVSGVRIDEERGSVRLSGRGSRLKITAESRSMEAARELCDEIRRKAAEYDRS